MKVATAHAPWGVMKPAWWPDWMSPPPLMAGGHVRPLGDCIECGAPQWSGMASENHFGTCSRSSIADKAPWPRNFRWPAEIEVPD